MLQKLPGFRPLTQHGEFTPPPPPPSSKSAKPICYSRFIRSADEKFFTAVFHEKKLNKARGRRKKDETFCVSGLFFNSHFIFISLLGEIVNSAVVHSGPK